MNAVNGAESQPALLNVAESKAPEKFIPRDKLYRLTYSRLRDRHDEATPQLMLTDQSVTRATKWGEFKVRPYGTDWDRVE